MDPFIIGSAITAGGSLLSSLFGNKKEKELLKMQIQAQRDMNNRNIAFQEAANAQNIASQEKINQSQIDFQKEINSLMRKDAKHAISDKRTDLMRAGYSTADPSLSGFSAASLGAPALTAPQVTAPQVESEFSPQMASTLINSKNTAISNATQLAATLTDISLKRAQKSKTDAETEGIVKSNAWIDLEKDASYSLLLQTIDNSFKDGVIKQKQADMLTNELSSFKTRFDLLNEQLSSLQISNKSLEDRFKADLSETLARVSNIKSDTKKKDLERDLLSIDKDLKNLELKYAKMGINFNASDLFSSIARIAGQGTAPQILDAVMTSIDQMIGTLAEGLFNGAVTLGKNAIKSVANGAGYVAKKLLGQ